MGDRDRIADRVTLIGSDWCRLIDDQAGFDHFDGLGSRDRVGRIGQFDASIVRIEDLNGRRVGQLRTCRRSSHIGNHGRHADLDLAAGLATCIINACRNNLAKAELDTVARA